MLKEDNAGTCRTQNKRSNFAQRGRTMKNEATRKSCFSHFGKTCQARKKDQKKGSTNKCIQKIPGLNRPRAHIKLVSTKTRTHKSGDEIRLKKTPCSKTWYQNKPPRKTQPRKTSPRKTPVGLEEPIFQNFQPRTILEGLVLLLWSFWRKVLFFH